MGCGGGNFSLPERYQVLEHKQSADTEPEQDQNQHQQNLAFILRRGRSDAGGDQDAAHDGDQEIHDFGYRGSLSMTPLDSQSNTDVPATDISVVPVLLFFFD
jgi:hypothetical protein